MNHMAVRSILMTALLCDGFMFIQGVGFLPEWSHTSITELEYDKTNKMTSVPSKDSDQPGHPPIPISLHCPPEGLVLYLPIMHTDQSSLGHTGHFVGFVQLWLRSNRLSIFIAVRYGQKFSVRRVNI